MLLLWVMFRLPLLRALLSFLLGDLIGKACMKFVAVGLLFNGALICLIILGS